MKRFASLLTLLVMIGCDKDATTTDPTPAAPDALFALRHSQGHSLTWRDQSTNETSFELEFALGGGSYNLLATLPANQTTFTHTAIQPPLYHKYRVRACNEHGCSPYSSEAGRNAEYLPEPPKIVSLTVTNNIVTQTALSSQIFTGMLATQVHVEYAPVGVSFANGARSDTHLVNAFYDPEGYLLPTPYFRTVAVEASTTYSLRLIARNILGSDTSAVVTFTSRAP